MSTGSVGSVSQNDTSQLIQQLAAKVDANQDGQISTGEFAQFLSRLLGSTSVSPATKNNVGGPPDAGSSFGSLTFDPSTWTDNNAPYGVTFAGFSPQDHTDFKMSDLLNPSHAKYLVYDYLVSNGISPNSNWAPAAAAALNQIVGSERFIAVSGVKLVFGDQSVHTAPNGKGMLPGTYNPTATGEFLWSDA